MSATDALNRLGVTTRGLSIPDATARLREFGPNVVPTVPPAAAWRVLVEQYRSIIAGLLTAAALVAMTMGDMADAIAIGAILLLNGGLGFAIEMRARRAVDALARLEPHRATVLRSGTPLDIDARDVVPGDILLLEAGQTIAADARLLAGAELRAVESALTGESAPVSKADDRVLEVRVPLPERVNMVFAGSAIAAGTGRAVVVATGRATELGAIGELVRTTREPQTPLERRLDTLGRQLVWVALGAGALVAGLAAARGAPLGTLLQTALALAVAAVPEGLPVVATMALALGVHRMARRHAIVRRLPAVEALGSVTLICTDKTGTLTSGAMTVTTLIASGVEYEVEGVGYAPVGRIRPARTAAPMADSEGLAPVLSIAALANDASIVLAGREWTARGDPTDAALVALARKGGLDREELLAHLTKVGEIPFSSERKWMAMMFRDGHGDVTAYAKGAPDRILDLCSSVLTDRGAVPLTAQLRTEVLAQNHRLAARGLRMLALASGRNHRLGNPLADLTLMGLTGMTDPPAADVRDTIQRFRRAGIETVMLTGDQRLTAEAVARDLGLSTSGPIPDAAALEEMSDEELTNVVAHTTIFSRVSPSVKLRITAAYQRLGHCVAMLGDGVNDAAALKKADVGVTMGGRGTDVARETAAVVLADDRFATIGVAIEEGRIIFDNIRKFVFYLFSCNLAEILVLVGASLAGMPLVLQPLQILWLNLVTDTLPALSLVVEPGEPDVMRRPPRNPSAGLLSRRFARSVVWYAALIAAAPLAVIIPAHVRGEDPARIATLAFTTLALAQLFHLGNARSRGPVLAPRRAFANLAAVLSVAVTVLLLVSAVYWTPLARLLESTPLDLSDWLVVLTLAMLPALLGQALKAAADYRHCHRAMRQLRRKAA